MLRFPRRGSVFAALRGGAKAPTIDFKRVLQVAARHCHRLEITCFSVSFLVREHKDLLFCTLCFHMERRCLCKASDLIKKLAVLGYYQSWTKHFAAVIIAIDFTFIESCKFTQCLINTKFPGLQLVIGELGGLFFLKPTILKKINYMIFLCYFFHYSNRLKIRGVAAALLYGHTHQDIAKANGSNISQTERQFYTTYLTDIIQSFGQASPKCAG